MINVIIVMSLALITRLLVIRKAGIDFDTFGHIYFAKEVKNQRSGPFGAIIPNVVASKPFRHPFLWHWVIGLISFEYVYNNKKWINAVIDTIFVGVIYVIIYTIYGSSIAFNSALLYIFTPIMFSGISTGPRIRSLTPRITSEIAVNLYFILILLPLPIPEYVGVPLSILYGVYTLLSSKFGVQAIVLLSILISLLLFSYKPILILLTSILLSILLSKGFFFKTLKQQANHLVWYFKKNLKGEMSISNRNSLSLLKEKSKDKKGILKIGTILVHFIITNSFGVVIFKMPVLIVSFFLFFYSNTTIDPAIFNPVLAGVLIFLAVNIPILLFIGEAERYLNHVIVFVLLMTTISAIDLNLTWVIWTLIGYGLLYWMFETFIYNKIIHKKLDRDTKEEEENDIIDFLKSFNEEKIILSFPYHAVGIWRILLETTHKTVYPIMVTKEFSDNFEAKYDAGYPYVDLKKLNEMDDDFGLDILILDNERVKYRYGGNWEPPKKWKLQFVSGVKYSIYEKK